MNRAELKEALECYRDLAEGLTEGDPDAIQSVREALYKIGSSVDESIKGNLIIAFQGAFMRWSRGPLDDLLIGLNVLRCLAEIFLHLEEQSGD